MFSIPVPLSPCDKHVTCMSHDSTYMFRVCSCLHVYSLKEDGLDRFVTNM